jgi:hypothetical protein
MGDFMKAKILIASGTLAVVATSAATAGVLMASGPSTNPAQRYDHLSNVGTPVVVSRRNADILVNGAGKPVLNHLGTRDGMMFYAGPGSAGGQCYALGAAKTGGIVVLGCLDPAAPFPSKDVPILDMSGIAGDPRTHTVTLLELSGFAADGVATVGLIDVNGVLHSAEVRENIYYANLPQVQARALVAVDLSGKEIFRRALG